MYDSTWFGEDLTKLNQCGGELGWGELAMGRNRQLPKKGTITGYFRFVFVKKTRSGKLYDYPDIIVLEKLRFRDGIRQA